MKNLKTVVNKLNETSESMLSLLATERPSMKDVQNFFEQRKDSIQQLGFIKSEVDEETFSEEVGALEQEFSTFRTLSEEINHRIFDLRENQQEKLARVKKQKMASDSYKVSKAPNISYFK